MLTTTDLLMSICLITVLSLILSLLIGLEWLPRVYKRYKRWYNVRLYNAHILSYQEGYQLGYNRGFTDGKISCNPAAAYDLGYQQAITNGFLYGKAAAVIQAMSEPSIN